MYWRPEKNGFFTVKSAYWIARDTVLSHVLTSTSNGDPFSPLWKRLWQTKIPGKVKNCIWRACNNLLPTKAALLKKGFQGDTTCLLCPASFEDNMHVFCHCPTAKAILTAPPFHLVCSSPPITTFKDWCYEHAISMQQDTFEKLLMILWALWKNRNTKFWHGIAQPSNDIVFGALSWLAEYKKANLQSQLKTAKSQKKWCPDTNGNWKLNVDGSFLPNQHRGGLGGVLRDEHGHFKAAFALPIAHVAAAKQVELLAIKQGLLFLQSFQTPGVVLETDCLEATKEIANPQYAMVEFAAVIDDIQEALSARTNVRISFAPRTCNVVAHRLASLAFEDNYSAIWADVPPDCILDVLQSDCTMLC